MSKPHPRRQFTIAIFNLENVTSVTILKVLISEMTHLEPEFLLFTNVSMEPHFTKPLIKDLREKHYLSDHPLPVGKGGEPLPTKELLFRNQDIIPMDKVGDNQFDKNTYGYRTFTYALAPVLIEGKGEMVKIRTFTMPRGQDVYVRNSQISAMCVGDLELRTVDLLTSDFLIRHHELYSPPLEWLDVYDYKGSSKEDQNYGNDRRDRVWFRSGSAKVIKMSSAEVQDPDGKLQGEKLITYVTLSNESW